MEYLERIGLGRPTAPDVESFCQVHTAQAFTIPFENIDIHLGRFISLKTSDLADKILRRRRGGYCFELNGILHQALKALGYSVYPHMARVLYGRTAPSERTHEVLVVSISGSRWLADVGFGGPGLRSPIPMLTEQFHEQYGERFRLRRDPELGLVLQKETNGLLLDLYAFDENELTLDVDIEMGNHFASTSSASIFRLHRMCSLAQPWGRITLNDMQLTIHRDGRSITRALPPGPDYMAALARHFAIDTGARYEDLMPLKSIPFS